MLSDLKYILRQLAKSPGFVLTAVVTLALGIGANAVVFSVLNALVLRPLNVPQAENLFTIQRFQFPSHSYLDYVDLRDRNHSFANVMAYSIVGPVGLDTGNSPMNAWPYLVSGNYFDSLGAQPYLGRLFHASDEKGENSAPYVVLSYAFWHSRFRDDPAIIGRKVQVNTHPFTVIGVAPRDFRGTELFFSPAFFVPMVEQPIIEGSNELKSRGNHSTFVIGRLKQGVSVAQATSDLNTLGAWLAKTYPSDDDGIKFSLARPGLVGDMLGGPARAFMTGLMLLAGLILLAACANLGSLFAARASDRSKEIALRLALGSRRSLILRQLLTEAVLVSLVGGVLGLIGGVVILRILSAWQPIPGIPINVPVNPDLRTYAFALVLALLSGLLFGTVPVRQVLRADPWQTIRTGVSGNGIRRVTFRDVMLAAQIGICAMLVASSLVALRGLVRSLHSSYGFVPDKVTLVECDLHMAGYSNERSAAMQRRMIETALAVPGVTQAGYASELPLSLGGGDSYVYTDQTTDFRPTNYAADAMSFRVSPGYIAAAETRLLAGRDLTFSDDKDSPRVALVNRQFALKVFGSVQKAVGGHFKFWGKERAEVIGVVEDGKYRTLTEDQQPAMFFSFQQYPASGTWIVVRSSRPTNEIASTLDTSMRALDPGLPFTVRAWNAEMGWALFAARVATVALGVLGLLGVMLAITGIFGMASYVVSKRLRELGIRVALGANRRQILSASVGRAFRLLVIGSVAGIALSVVATRVLSFIVYQATPKDPVVLVGVTATMLLLGLVAAWIPARRALAIDPLILLREE
jgi:predicted permease